MIKISIDKFASDDELMQYCLDIRNAQGLAAIEAIDYRYKLRALRREITRTQEKLYKLEEEQPKETPTPPDTKPWANYICDGGCCHMTEHQHEFSLDPQCGGRWTKKDN